jgi:hypothetical protein
MVRILAPGLHSSDRQGPLHNCYWLSSPNRHWAGQTDGRGRHFEGPLGPSPRNSSDNAKPPAFPNGRVEDRRRIEK